MYYKSILDNILDNQNPSTPKLPTPKPITIIDANGNLSIIYVISN